MVGGANRPPGDSWTLVFHDERGSAARCRIYLLWRVLSLYPALVSWLLYVPIPKLVKIENFKFWMGGRPGASPDLDPLPSPGALLQLILNSK